MNPVATTHEGRLEGEFGAHGVSVFRGVSYAAPPVGALRLRAPVPMRTWQGTRDARRFRAPAPQDHGPLLDISTPDEDCLTLNVWTPACDRRRRAVMVWIHGGSFTVGSGAQGVYDGSMLAEHGDVVVVTLNYRLGALGFSFLRDLLGPAHELASNPGLLDQLAALAWVQRNIDAFGGNPDNVTVFGGSAGAMCIGSLLAVPRAQGLFRRAILQSGAAHHATSRDDASRIAEVLLHRLGVDPNRPDKLWSVPAAAIVMAQRACLRETILRGPRTRRLPQGAMTLIPVGDGELLPDGPFDAIAAGAARGVDLLIGTNEDEWNYFLFLVEADKQELDEATLHKVCEQRLPGRGSEAVALYRSVLGGRLSPAGIYAAIESDRTFRIPVLRLAEAQLAHRGTTFMYRFGFHSPMFGGEMGACHGLETPFVFGTVDGEFGRAFSGGGAQAVDLSRRMRAAWAAFAHTGDPNHEGLPEWRPYEPSRRETMRLAPHCELQSAPLEAVRPFWDGVQ